MRAVRYTAYAEPPVVADVADPACPPDGVVIRVGATGVCRSDWHAWLGHDPVPLPMVPGHELAGVVELVGAEVTRWRAGDRVTVPFACGCGQCEECAQGNTNVCPQQTQPGFTGWGSFAELVAIHAADTNVVALPDSLGFVAAASLGCRFATAYRAVVPQGRVAAGEWLAVHGCGGVGLSAVMIGAALGARVVAVDVSDPALRAAREAGAEAVVQATGLEPAQVAAAVIEATGDGAHVSIDALGSPAAMTASVLSLRPRGRHVQVGLLLDHGGRAAVPMGRAIARELELLGVHGLPARDYPAMLRFIETAGVDLGRLVGRVIGLDEAPDALMAMSAAPAFSGMTVVEPGR
ncbi:MAG TPA: zinc-dependent alcohol dehydrogenase family protein [Candidatus Limnocylindrales bacterium]